VDEKLDGVEIDFDVFVGKNKNIYTQLLINNLRKNKIEINRDNAYKYLIAHVNRGINIIYNKKLKNITELFEFD
jgi:DNA sulfur modification protein DndE